MSSLAGGEGGEAGHRRRGSGEGKEEEDRETTEVTHGISCKKVWAPSFLCSILLQVILWERHWVVTQGMSGAGEEVPGCRPQGEGAVSFLSRQSPVGKEGSESVCGRKGG